MNTSGAPPQSSVPTTVTAAPTASVSSSEAPTTNTPHLDQTTPSTVPEPATADASVAEKTEAQNETGDQSSEDTNLSMVENSEPVKIKKEPGSPTEKSSKSCAVSQAKVRLYT